MDDADRADARPQCEICAGAIRLPATLCERCTRILGIAALAELPPDRLPAPRRPRRIRTARRHVGAAS